MIEWPNAPLAMAGTYDRLPKTAPSLCQLSWPKGRSATLFKGQDSNGLRGPEHDFT